LRKYVTRNGSVSQDIGLVKSIIEEKRHFKRTGASSRNLNARLHSINAKHINGSKCAIKLYITDRLIHKTYEVPCSNFDSITRCS
jgi:hypothetical protein